ncbi:MAG: hypothetical protein JF615_02170 [Asticcacaulis sp.]|nr:hypothetical protein [Asticcacaulis sp.]
MLKFAAAVLAAGLLLPGLASAEPLPVKLELFGKDRTSKAFAVALNDAVAGDSRFVLVDTLPDNGMRLIMADSLQPQNDEVLELLGYDFTFKLGSGQYVGEARGLCDKAKMAMCGRLVAEDAYKAYAAYIAGKK